MPVCSEYVVLCHMLVICRVLRLSAFHRFSLLLLAALVVDFGEFVLLILCSLSARFSTLLMNNRCIESIQGTSEQAVQFADDFVSVWKLLFEE